MHHWNSTVRLVGLLAGTLAGAWVLAAPRVIDLPSARAYPESLSSSKDGTLYVGNLAEGGVVRIRPDAKPEIWIKPGSFGSGSILGVLVDEPSNTLWVCSDDLSSAGLKIAGAGTGSALIGFDLKTGGGKIRAPFAGEHNLCNDIAIGPDGSAYVSNSDTPQILRLPPGGDKLEVWFTAPPSLAPATHDGTGIDGLAFGGDGNLYINTFDAGDLYRVDVKDGKAGKLTQLKPPHKLQLTDGLRAIGPSTFLLIEGAGRVDVMTVKGDDVGITTLHAGYVTPTGVTQIGSTAWVSEGQLDFIFDPKLKGKKPREPFRVYGVSIPSAFLGATAGSTEAPVGRRGARLAASCGADGKGSAVGKPKEHIGAMPPNGGTQLSSSDLQAVAAYVWALGHPGAH